MQAIDPARRRVPFLLWGWAMLVVVLLSASPTGAAPRSRLVGSAFDPATVSVALNPKQPKAVDKLTAGERPDPDSGAPPVLAASVVHVPAAAAIAVRSAHAAGLASLADPRALVRAHGPRAPPAG